MASWQEARWVKFLQTYEAEGYEAAAKAIVEPCEDGEEEAILKAKSDMNRYANEFEWKNVRLEAWGKAKQAFLKSLEPRRQGLVLKSFDTYDEVLDDKDPKSRGLRLHASETVLKGEGIFSDKQKVEHTGEGGGPVRVEIGNADKAKPFKEIIET